jgi:imidazolonepropionase-like amidohydrolase
MRIDPFLDSFYVLGSLWGLPGSQVCPSSPAVLPRPAAALSWAAGPAAAAVTAFVDVNVVPMDTERVLPRHTVLVEGGRITALGPSDKVSVPANATRIDGKGKYLMPGLADMHVHLMNIFGREENVRQMFRFLAHGVTTVRNLNWVGGDSSAHRRRLEQLGIHGDSAAMWQYLRTPEVLKPRLYYGAYVEPEDLAAMGMAGVATRVAAYKAAGFDFVKIRADVPRDLHATFDSLLKTARRSGFTVSSHSNGESFPGMLGFGAYGGSVEHLYAFGDTAGGPDVSPAVLHAVARATKHAGTWITPTLDCVDEVWRKTNRKPQLATARKVVKALHDAGVGLLIGADADGKGLSPSIINEELNELLRAGLTPYQALLTGTRNVAEYLGKLDSSGTVAVGKWADLVLLRGNPLADIRYVREPVGVMIAGRWLDRATLDQGLLASPAVWYRFEIEEGIMPARPSIRGWRAKALADSLMAVPPSDTLTSRRLVRRLTEELGAMRAHLTPEQREAFDPSARVWMREQARKGAPVVVPGVTP